MIKGIKYGLVSVLLLCACNGFTQRQVLDSLLRKLPAERDTGRVGLLYDIAWELLYSNPDSALLLTKQGIEIMNALPKKKLKQPRVIRHLSNMYNMLGSVYQVKSQYKQSRKAYNAALKMEALIKDQGRIANIKANLGIVCFMEGDFPRALDYYFEALHIAEMLNDEPAAAIMLGNIGIVNVELKEYKKALTYYFKALKILKRLNDEAGLDLLLGNIGVVYSNLGNGKAALKYYNQALKIAKQTGDLHGQSNLLHNMAVVYREEHKNEKALELLFKSLEIAKSLELNNIVANCNTDIGAVYINMIADPKADRELVKKAESHLLLALDLNKTLGTKKNEMDVEGFLGLLYEKTGEYERSLAHYKNHYALQDSIINNEKGKEIASREMNYTFEGKRAAEKAEQKKREALAKIELKQKEQQQYFLIAGILLLGALAVFILRGYRQKQKDNFVILEQKRQVEEKNRIIEEKQKEIIDSIYYARRIQKALIPSEKYIDRVLHKLTSGS